MRSAPNPCFFPATSSGTGSAPVQTAPGCGLGGDGRLKERTSSNIPNIHGPAGSMFVLHLSNLLSPAIRAVTPMIPFPMPSLQALSLALSHLSSTMLAHPKPSWASRNPRKEVWCCLVCSIQSLCSCWWPQGEFLHSSGLEPIWTPPEIEEWLSFLLRQIEDMGYGWVTWLLWVAGPHRE